MSIDPNSASAPRRRPGRRLRIGDALVQQGTITPEQLAAALAAQNATPPGELRKRLGAVVVECGFATERQVAAALATAMGLDIADLRNHPPDMDDVRSLPQNVAQRCGVVILGRTGTRVRLAAADPTNVLALDDVRLHLGAADLMVQVATETDVRDLLNRAWSLSSGGAEVTSYLDELRAHQAVEDAPVIGQVGATDDAPIVRLVTQILADAVRARASDVHIQPEANSLRVRYRVDGVLRDVMTVPRTAGAGLVSRIKIISGLDIAERRLPQDGRSRLKVDGTEHDSRVSTLPGLHGEKVVIRLLSRAEAVADIADIGLDATQLAEMLTAMRMPQGLVLITGPTGSGKTNTLYSSINRIQSPELNIITLEDPVEIQVPGVTQVQVNVRTGLTFARGLRSVLRQDPDIVLVGEIRDTETANLAFEAAMTGHLVLSTLHTNNAPAALSRLVDMGVEPFLVASSLTLVAGQRLARRPCDTCAEAYLPAAKVLQALGLTAADLAEATPRRGRGCPDCGGTGYRGRIGLFEVLSVTPGIRAVLLATPTESAVASAARAAGMTTLRVSGLQAARRGDTTFEEVLRVTTAAEGDGIRCPTCHSGLAADMVSCPWCETPVGQGRCAQCNRTLDPAWRHCPWCRTAVAASALPQPRRANPRPRLLLVSSDEELSGRVATALGTAATVDVVDNGDEALERAATVTYTGLIVDDALPGTPALQLASTLRHAGRIPMLPIVLASGDPAVWESLGGGVVTYAARAVEPAALRGLLLEDVSGGKENRP
ncbi:MAG: ATPase, T2SS/T4P/T4SS family [Frankiaceae bacterium]